LCLDLSYAAIAATIASSAVIIACGVALMYFCCVGEYACVRSVAAGAVAVMCAAA